MISLQSWIMLYCPRVLKIQRVVISGGNFKPDTLKPKEVVSLLLDDDELEKKCAFAILFRFLYRNFNEEGGGGHRENNQLCFLLLQCVRDRRRRGSRRSAARWRSARERGRSTQRRYSATCFLYLRGEFDFKLEERSECLIEIQPFVWCEVRGLTKIIGCHSLGTIPVPDFTAIWPVFLELSCSRLKCWTDGQDKRLNTPHRRP